MKACSADGGKAVDRAACSVMQAVADLRPTSGPDKLCGLCRNQQLYTLNAQAPADNWEEVASSMQRAARSFHVF